MILRHELTGGPQFAGLDPRLIAAQRIAPGLQDHNDLFERGVAGTFADAVDRAFNLPGAVHDRGQ